MKVFQNDIQVTSFEDNGLFKKPVHPKDILEKENIADENAFSRKSKSNSPITSTPSIEDKNKSPICDHTCAETVKTLESKILNLSKTAEEMESLLKQKEEDIHQRDIEIERCLRVSEARKLMLLNREKELIDLRTLNRDLQDAAIDNLISLEEQLEKTKVHSKAAEKEEYEVGHRDETKRMIYISRGEWMGYDTFKMCTDNVKTYAQVAKNLAVAIFGYEVLHKATITGKNSNHKIFKY
ncbi:uncharacterized protein LOC117178233 isoform X2 [Belonocnema kinseyi]|uniref:uncharacterized protein LOC117178233 isoform X2 n=1 Tax=Belonocnema kinseyi TaxID=2817044 RepID=UPI00143DC997|nr:uncharacterized protein LOC117178233 isoform X2 [Belonocnema kinseyi]